MVNLRRKGDPNTTQATRAINKDSHVISKLKPKIRIIHIFAPKIIKTDVANFQELVQRLTGKPTSQKDGKKKLESAISKEELEDVLCNPAKMVQLEETFTSFPGYGAIVKEEDEIWRGENSFGCFGGLGDFNGLVHGISEFPIIPF